MQSGNRNFQRRTGAADLKDPGGEALAIDEHLIRCGPGLVFLVHEVLGQGQNGVAGLVGRPPSRNPLALIGQVADNAGHEHETAANVTSFAVPEDVNETDRRVAHIVVNAFNSAGSSAGAVAEWDDATPTRVATPPATAASLDASVDDSGNVTWAAVAGAAGYRVHGTLEAMRVNAVNPFCTPPVDSPLTLPVDIDVTLGADATRYPSSLPPVAAGDRWYVFRSSVQVDALAPDGTVLTSAGSSGIGETGCRVDTISAPSTGSAAPDAAWPLGGSAIAPVAALAGAACVGFGLRMRVR